jgi:hypothetical protein
MQRRSFIKSTLITSAGLMLIPAFNNVYGYGISDADTSPGFLNPPDDCRPWCYWMWMNGNITKEGITLDLEAMKRMGIGGVINFNVAVGIPRGTVNYGSDEWMELMFYTAKEAERLGISYTMQNSPGYSGCGGPWVTPEMSMQQLVWTETRASGKNISVSLSKPFGKHNYYQDALVIAYPSLTVEKVLMKDHVTAILANGNPIDKTLLLDGNPETKIRIEPFVEGDIKKPASLIFKFDEPFDAQAISITRSPEVPVDLFDGPRDRPPLFTLESSDDGLSYNFIGNINCPELRAMDTPAVLSFPLVKAKYYRLTSATATWVCGVELHNGPRLGGWPGKTNYTHGDSIGETPVLDKALLIDPDKVLDITNSMTADGKLNWQAPAENNWTILRIGHTTTGEEPAAHPDSAKGLEIDKLRKDALDLHFEHFLDKVILELKPFLNTSFKGIMADSWEAGKQNWTLHFPEEFKQRRAYDIIQWMPALTGRIVGNVDDTERFLWDFRKTHADLLSENFYGHFQQCCHQCGLQFMAEPYGDGTFDSLQSAQYLDVPMAEFWSRYIYGTDTTSKQAASSAHVHGNKVAAAEAFTGMPANSHWADYPYSLKAEGDYFFTLGINRLVLHTFVHQPYQTAKPGMTMGPFGTHFDRNNTWTEQAHGWINYITRTQYLLQQGLFVADACYFKGDVPESGVPDTYQFMPAGFVCDVIGPDALKLFNIKDGKIVLADGMSYRLCIMAKLTALLPQTLNRLKELVNAGMILVVSNKPGQGFGHTSTDAQIQLSIDELYGEVDGHEITQHSYGKGKLIWNDSIASVFRDLSIEPDFTCSAENEDAAIHYIHKKTADMEYYFISNHRRRHEKITLSLRIAGMQPELWNTETGERYLIACYTEADRRINIPLELEQASSVFVVFRKKIFLKGCSSITKDGVTIADCKPYLHRLKNPYPDVQNNFTIHLWAKPDSFAQEGKSMLFHPADGGEAYGKGHATVGLSAGQNAVRVYEKSSATSKTVLVAERPIEGWTHLALVYEQGKPALYVNGKLTASGKASGLIIHPGLKTPASNNQFTSYFEGNYTEPILSEQTLSAEAIMALYQKGLPAPRLEKAIDVKQLPTGKLEALVWQNGYYMLKSSTGTKALGNVTGCYTDTITGSWQVKFPAGSGAPESTVFPELMSLRHHSNFNIKYFSGTVTYHKIISVGTAELQTGKKLFLDLGRVEVVAGVKLNGKSIALLWKEPFLLDITSAARPGDNELEIAVTTLWANRLIGDEQLPVENTYSKDGPIAQLPEWYIYNKPKHGERKTFSVWHNLDKNSPMLESGLLGPVKLLTAIQIIT